MSPDGQNPEDPRFTQGAGVAQNSEMSEEAENVSAEVNGLPLEPVSAVEPLIFEQPLNERMRTFLRLDFLYNQALYHNEMQSQWGSRAAMGSLIDILAIAARSDVRADVMKELERHLAQLNVFQSKPGVDSARLRTVMSNLLRLRADLVACGSNYLASLKDSEFLSAIKHRSAIPGGTCEFDLPAYYAWQQLDAGTRQADLARWSTPLGPLAESIHLLLRMLRDSGSPQKVMAVSGQFQQTLPQGRTFQLLRLRIDPALRLVPEISGNRLMVSVRLMKQEGSDKLQPSTDNADFELTLCS